MLVFVDESGDCGLKIGNGSTEQFIVTLILFEEHDEAEAVDERISLLKKEMGLHPYFEFHFNKCKAEIRKGFLEAVVPYNFFYCSIVINKAKLYGPGFKYKETFYKYISSLVFQNAKPHLDEATVILDGNGSKEFRLQLARYLKNKINNAGESKKISKVKMQNSKDNNLLQLADMVCGAVARSFKRYKDDADDYRRIIKPREISVQAWP